MDIGIASIINLSCLGGVIYLSSNLVKEKKEHAEFMKAKVYSPNRLLSYFTRDDFRKVTKKSEDNPEEYIVRAFVEGIADCKTPVKSIIDGKSKLVYSYYYRDEIYSNDSFNQARGYNIGGKKQIQINAPLYFHLKDPHSSDTCLVHRSFEVNATSAIEKIAEYRELKPLSWFEKLLVYIGMLIEFIALTTKNTFSFRGIKVGWMENELGISVGSVITAYGDIIYNLKDKSIRIDSPLYFLTEKSNIIKNLKKMIFGTQTKIFFLSIPFILSTVYLVKKALAFYKEIQRKRREEQLDRLRNIKFIQLQDDYKCIICVDRPRNIILKPCLHFSMCAACYGSLRRKICPVCKKNITDAIEVFFT